MLKGIDLDLPIWYEAGRPDKGEALKGFLSVNKMAMQLLPEQGLAIKLIAGPNRLSVTAPTFFRVPGGRVRIGSVAARDIFRARALPGDKPFIRPH